MNKKTTLLALGITTALGSVSAQAADKELLDMLLQNGAINHKQYNALLKKSSLSKSDISDVKVKLGKKGLQFQTADKNFKLKIGGRLHADATFHSNDNLTKKADSGTEIRRARIHLKGTMWKDFFYKSQFDFAENKVGVKDLYIGYKGIKGFQVIVGNQKQPVSEELQESSNDIMFTERSLLTAMSESAFDRAIGINTKAYGKNWHVQAGVYGDAVGHNAKNAGEEGWGVGARASFAPINTKTQVVHLGASVGYREVAQSGGLYKSNNNYAQFKNETAHMTNLFLTDTGKITDAKSFTVAGAEAGYMQGPFSVQAEYMRGWVDRTAQNPTLEFDGFYVQTAWTLTGESRSYKGKDGKFKRLKPSQPFSFKNGGIGAIELAARYDQIDLSSNGWTAPIINGKGGETGGHQKGVTMAVNWYLNENVRLMADYRVAFDVKGSPVTTAAGGRVPDQDIVTLRAQWAF
ncbi:OprO/OprP family phosphate-selective porin [methane-oxidizing endosymbiont of Gigantopelta aegis]|uniref:OprO/OprP family phosphate-selective porin n=1 Tax=methane-oxidizing endosymbiont of Gigantopelta aegis TaxID=2794938 RepID=UPI0018DAFBD5|nr:porin [methane-oxidizing endosymbiont of Gigantopelta aegis]